MRTSLRKTAVRLGLVITAIFMSFAVASPSMAANQTLHTDDGDPGGSLAVTWYGDIVTICDIEADGWGVYVKVTDVSQNLYKYEMWVGGNGNCKTHRASEDGPYNLREDNYFSFKLCLRKSDEGGVTLDYCDYATWKNYE